MTEESGVRGAIVDLANEYVGLCADDDAYMELIAPSEIESPQMRRDMATMDSCALVVRGLWRRSGLEHPILEKPYRLTHAVSDVVQIATDRDALRGKDDFANVEPGDVVIVDGDKRDAHVFTVIDVDSPDAGGIRMMSVDGGQRIGDHGREGVAQIIRTMAKGMDHRMTPPQSIRTVTHVIDCERLFAEVVDAQPTPEPDES